MTRQRRESGFAHNQVHGNPRTALTPGRGPHVDATAIGTRHRAGLSGAPPRSQVVQLVRRRDFQHWTARRDPRAGQGAPPKIDNGDPEHAADAGRHTRGRAGCAAPPRDVRSRVPACCVAPQLVTCPSSRIRSIASTGTLPGSSGPRCGRSPTAGLCLRLDAEAPAMSLSMRESVATFVAAVELTRLTA